MQDFLWDNLLYLLFIFAGWLKNDEIFLECNSGCNLYRILNLPNSFVLITHDVLMIYSQLLGQLIVF